MLWRVLPLLMVLVLSVLPASVWGSVLGAVADALKMRFRVSGIEVGNAALEGQVVRRGVVLTLQAEAIPAKGFRAIQANTKSPRFHVRDYARVEVTPDGRLNPQHGEFSLARGTRLVVLDLKVEPSRVRLFTHTLERVPATAGKTRYGCTEFVFNFEPGVLARGEVSAVQNTIERWLTRAPTA